VVLEGANQQSGGGMRKRGFTLVELLVVVGVIAILLAMLLPALQKARSSAIQVQCMSQQRQMMTGFFMYANANSNYLPPAMFQNKDDFLSGTLYWVAWWNRYQLGQYMGIKTRGKDYPPSTYNEGYVSRVDPGAALIFCPEYYREKLTQGSPINSDLGYGVNVYSVWPYSAKIMGYKLNTLRNPSNVIVMADVYRGITMDSFYATETGSNNYVYYRHSQNRNTVVSFGDGHTDVVGRSAKQSVYGYKTGLHQAFLTKQMFATASNR
jgi:prepilin-type N-terminal cleavage/methylation domain-containing protein